MGTRIMVVEDNITNLAVARQTLIHLGLDTVTVASGAEALARLADTKIDLILMDIQMPEMDGLETTRRIRALPPPVGQVPIVAMTANAFESNREAALAAGMNGFLTKPVRRTMLRAVIFPLLQQPGGSGALTSRVAHPSLQDDTSSDMASLRRELGDDTVDELFAILATDFAQTLPAMAAAAASGDGVAMRALLHRISGAALNLGIEDLAAAIASIPPGADPTAPSQAAALDTVMRGMRRYIERTPGMGQPQQ